MPTIKIRTKKYNTATGSARMRASYKGKTVSIPYPYEMNSDERHKAAAVAFVKERGWSGRFDPDGFDGETHVFRRDGGLGEIDTDDLPWISLNYGELPSKAVFDRQFIDHVGRGKRYSIGMNRSDERLLAPFIKLIGGVTIDSEKNKRDPNHFNVLLTRDELYDLVKHLAHHGYGEEANDFASSILYTLHIEWI